MVPSGEEDMDGKEEIKSQSNGLSHRSEIYLKPDYLWAFKSFETIKCSLLLDYMELSCMCLQLKQHNCYMSVLLVLHYHVPFSSGYFFEPRIQCIARIKYFIYLITLILWYFNHFHIPL